jgi:hypothetical protein
LSDEPSVNGSDPERPARVPGTDLAELLPGLARVATGAWVRTAVWGIEASLRLTSRVARSALSPDDAARLVQDVGSGLRDYARELLGVQDLDNRIRQLAPGPAGRMRTNARAPSSPTLREQGAELLRQSADVSADDEIHPAYARILSELAPDEGRILRLLATDGPQPSVDVLSTNLLGTGTQLVAQGVNMIGTEAGCRHVDRVPAYLNNLHRLGLAWFSRDPLPDPMRYQVLEAQPEAMEAIKQAGRAKTVHRTVRLTPFGEDFCRVVLPLQEPAEAEA